MTISEIQDILAAHWHYIAAVAGVCWGFSLIGQPCAGTLRTWAGDADETLDPELLEKVAQEHRSGLRGQRWHLLRAANGALMYSGYLIFCSATPQLPCWYSLIPFSLCAATAGILLSRMEKRSALRRLKNWEMRTGGTGEMKTPPNRD